MRVTLGQWNNLSPQERDLVTHLDLRADDEAIGLGPCEVEAWWMDDNWDYLPLNEEYGR